MRIGHFRSIPPVPCLVFLASTAQGQVSPSAPTRTTSAVGEIRGTMAELGSGRPVAAGSITARRDSDSVFAGGALPKADGSFRVDGLAVGHYTLRIRSLGYAPMVRGDIVITTDHPVVDVGTLALSPVAARLTEQVITSERGDVVLAPDRTSYSTKNMTTASGGTTVDVLRNIPSVEIDATNKVSLRGNENVVVQINGRSSPLHGEQLGNFLAQLPANSVARVEVATSPSAKSDPEGRAGIINIVLEQDAELGLSGGVSVGGSTAAGANMSGNVGAQSGPVTLFASFFLSRDTRRSESNAALVNIATPLPAFIDSRSEGSLAPRAQSVTVRSEYRVGGQNAIAADVIIAGSRYGRENATVYTYLDPARVVIGQFNQAARTRSRSLSQDYTVAFRRLDARDVPVLLTELRYTENGATNDLALSNRSTAGNPADALASADVRDITTSHFPAWTLQTDYTHLFGARTKLEGGAKATRRQTRNEFTADLLDPVSNAYLPIESSDGDFGYRDEIGAVYGVLSQEIGQMQLQGGLRLEQASSQLALKANNLQFHTHRGSAFPSAIVSYNPTQLQQIKLSYSRRISRPSPYQLSPIPNREATRSEYRGNPYLQPEYTDAAELSFQDVRSWGTMQIVPSLRRTGHAIRYIQRVDSTGVTLATYDNVASAVTVGTDVNVTMRRGSLTIVGGGTVARYTSDAANLTAGLSTKTTLWLTRANTTWNVTPLLDAQVFVNYRAPYAMEGGSQGGIIFLNMALRRKLWGEQGSVTVRAIDPFDMYRFDLHTADARVAQVTERRGGVRALYLTLSRNFGQQLKLRPRTSDPETQAPPPPSTPE